MNPRPCRFALALALLVAGVAAARAEAPPNVAKAAWDAAESEPAEILIRLRERADLSLAATLPARADKGRFVYLALRATAERSQKELRTLLAARGVEHRPYIIVNVIWARADRATMVEVAARPEVEGVLFNPRVHGLERIGGEPVQIGRMPGAPGRPVPQAVEWNVDLIGSPAAWAEGHRGEGIVVGNQDTGIRWTHETLKSHYRGWDEASGLANHDYNWHDAIHAPSTGGSCGPDTVEPCDDHGHGTHTMGTVVGSDGGANEVGSAPAAEWIGCRDMDQGVGTPATYLECFEFFLAPWPIGGDASMGDPLRAPDLTTNSWLCPPSEGCALDVLEDASIAQRAAGIMTIVAAGNSGSACGTANNPAGTYDSVYTVGASNSADGMAGFSSRGPAPPLGLVKPDIVAPGVGVRSGVASADDAYATWNGTSMATPNVAGAVTVFWSARPAYKGRVAETEDLFNATARRLTAIVESCGGDYVAGPNGTWGHGRIDVAAALAASCQPAFETSCDDGFDSDCDGLLDCLDPDCIAAAECPEGQNCTDGIDNDADGLTDCEDVDCDPSGVCPEPDHCWDRRDNDGDGLVDCADPDCNGDVACPESAYCGDGMDNDLDGIVDCADPDCGGDLGCPESAWCTDGLDQDRDGLIDCADPDCSGNVACPEAVRCGDGLDNDLDGRIDCLDDECVGASECPERGHCADGIDDDGNGLADCADPECAGDPACPEASWCSDGLDNDLDAAIDCADADCVADPACATADTDGDGHANSADCLPLDPGAFSVPPEVARLDVSRQASIVSLAWADVSASAGSGTRYEVAAASIATLHGAGFGAMACVARGVATPGWAIGGPDEAFLVRAVTACGPASGQGWGRDSLGRERLACP